MGQETYAIIKQLKKENFRLREYIRNQAKGDERFFAERFLKSLRTRDSGEKA